jgi:hypothetical protein
VTRTAPRDLATALGAKITTMRMITLDRSQWQKSILRFPEYIIALLIFELIREKKIKRIFQSFGLPFGVGTGKKYRY